MYFEKSFPPLALPKRFRNPKFAEGADQWLQDIVNEYLQNFEEYYRKGIAPAFFGMSGIGKSFAAAVIADKLDKKGVPVRWSSSVQTLNQLVDYRDFRKAEYWQLMSLLKTVPVLVFDDFGHIRKYERMQELLFQIIDARYSLMLPTVYTANFQSSEGGVEAFWEALGKEIGAPIARRIHATTGDLVYVTQGGK